MWKRLALVSISGCGGDDLVGRWSGDLDCGAGAAYSMQLDLRERGGDDQFRGEGSTEWSCQDTDGALLPCELTYAVDVDVVDRSEGELEMVLTDCVAVLGGEEYTSPCFEPWDVQYDGENLIDGYWDECLFVVHR